MKRTISILLAILSLAMLFTGCANGNVEPTETTAPAVKTDVAKPLTQADLDALPVASSEMTVDEQR